MRILLVAYFYEAAAGGGIIVARLLREQLQQRGHTVDVLCLAGSRETQPERMLRIELPRWAARPSDRVRQILLFLNNRFVDRWIFRRAVGLTRLQPRYDFVLAQDFLGVRVARRLADTFGVPCGATLHDTLPQQVSVGAPNAVVRYALNRLSRRRDRSLARDLSRFTWLAAVSRHVGDSANRWLQPSPPPVEVVYNPAPEAFAAVPPPECSDRLRFLFVGRLSPEKGVDLLVEAFRKVPGEHRLTILGLTGSLASSIQKAAKGDARIELQAAVQYSEMPKVYAQHQVVCCPVDWQEPFGLTVLEGRVTRRVVIGTERGGLPEILAGYPRAALFSTHGLTREQRIAKLAAAIGDAPRLLRVPLDEESEAKFLAQFRLVSVVDRYEQLIRQTL